MAQVKASLSHARHCVVLNIHIHICTHTHIHNTDSIINRSRSFRVAPGLASGLYTKYTHIALRKNTALYRYKSRTRSLALACTYLPPFYTTRLVLFVPFAQRLTAQRHIVYDDDERIYAPGVCYTYI